MKSGKNDSFRIVLPAQINNRPKIMFTKPKTKINGGILPKKIEINATRSEVPKSKVPNPKKTKKKNPIRIREIPPNFLPADSFAITTSDPSNKICKQVLFRYDYDRF